MALIALDGDGVVLDYNRGFGKVWEQFFGTPLTCAEPRAYHATNFWGVSAPDWGHPFWQHFAKHGWSDMPEMPGALDACNRLVTAGHQLVLVSSMPIERGPDRLKNLQALGFPIERVIATGHGKRGQNPKQAAIAELAPEYFVDDELRKLRDLGSVKTILVNPGHPDCPNAGQEKDFLWMEVSSLSEFAGRLLRPKACYGQ